MNSGLMQGLRILDLLVAEPRPLRLSELARSLQLSKSGLHALLATLVVSGYVEHLAGGFYQLGMKARRIADSLPTATLIQAAAPVMEALVAEAGEGAILGVLEGFEVAYVHLVEGNQIVRVHAQIGDRILAHGTSTGLALLAFQDEGFVTRWMPRVLPGTSSKTLTSADELRAELRRTRARGYAINRGGWHDDVGGIAYPVMGPNGPVAGLCMSLPLFRMDQRWINRVAPLVKRAALQIAEALAAPAIERRAAR